MGLKSHTDSELKISDYNYDWKPIGSGLDGRF